MDYARQQRDPAKHAIGIVFVVAVHVFVIWALLTGLARKAVEVVKKPLTATIIEEIKAPPPPPPPPPPPKRITEPPKVQAPEPYVPPPDIPAPQPQTAPTITVAPSPTPPTEPYVIAPPPPPVAAPAPPAPPKPAVRKDPQRLAGDDLVYPRQAIRAGISKGRVVARVMIDEKGNVYDVVIQSSDPPRVFDRTVIDGVKQWKYAAEGEKYVAEIEVIFVLKE
jgi:protein TonB